MNVGAMSLLAQVNRKGKNKRLPNSSLGSNSSSNTQPSGSAPTTLTASTRQAPHTVRSAPATPTGGGHRSRFAKERSRSLVSAPVQGAKETAKPTKPAKSTLVKPLVKTDVKASLTKRCAPSSVLPRAPSTSRDAFW